LTTNNQPIRPLTPAMRGMLWVGGFLVFLAGIQLYFMISDVDGFASRVPVGIPRPWPVQDKPWGLRELTLKTPSGFLITFAQRRR
jgi:hypothetical protein